MDDRTDPQYKLRMPPELHERLKAAAKDNHRSMNAEIVARLQSTFEETRLYGHRLSEEVTAEDANTLQEKLEAVELAIHQLLGQADTLHIASKRAFQREQREDQAARQHEKGEEGKGI